MLRTLAMTTTDKVALNVRRGLKSACAAALTASTVLAIGVLPAAASDTPLVAPSAPSPAPAPSPTTTTTVVPAPSAPSPAPAPSPTTTTTVVPAPAAPTSAPPSADLDVKQTATPAQDGIRLLITVHNNGPAAATAVTLRELLEAASLSRVAVAATSLPISCKATTPPQGWDVARMCTTPSITAGGTWRIGFKATGTTGEDVKASARAVSQTLDPNLDTNTGAASGLMGPVADLEAVVASSSTSVTKGGSPSAGVTIRNNGPNDAVKAVVTAVTKVTAGQEAPQFTVAPPFGSNLPSDCTTKTSQVGATTVKVTRCVIGPLGAGEEELGTLTWHSAPSGTTTIRTVDQASSPSYDPDSTNNSVSVTKPV